MSFEDKVWYQKLSFKNILAVAPLLPFTALFGAITSVRRKCYNNGFFKKTKLKTNGYYYCIFDRDSVQTKNGGRGIYMKVLLNDNIIHNFNNVFVND